MPHHPQSNGSDGLGTALPHTSAPHAGADARREPSPTMPGVGNVSVNHVDHGI